MNSNRLFIIIAALLLAAPASAWSPIPTETPVPTPTSTPTAEQTATPTPTPTAEQTATPSPTPIEKVLIQHSAAVILMDSWDGTSVLNKQEAEELVWTNALEDEWEHYGYVSGRARWLAASYDILELVRDTDLDEEADIYGPYVLQLNAEGQCGIDDAWSDWGNEARAAITAANEEITDYDHFIMVLPWIGERPNRYPADCGFGGMGFTNGRMLYVNQPNSGGTITHELGHNHGTGHTTDQTDIMTPGVRGLNAPNLIKLEYLPVSSVVQVDSGNPVVLLPLHVDPYEFPGTRVIEVPVPGGDPYYVSFRDDSNVDSYLDSEYQLAGYVHRLDGEIVVLPIQQLGVDETFIDEDNVFKVEVTDISEGAQHWEMTVEVTFVPTGVLAWQPFDRGLLR